MVNYWNYINRDSDRKYYHTNKYDSLIKNELNLNSWVFLSKYIIFEPVAKRKFLIKKHIYNKARWPFIEKIPSECVNKFLFEYEKFKNKYNVDIYPYISGTISNQEILDCFKHCCNHDFLPNILFETDNFLEIEYLDSFDWRSSTPYERTSNDYFNILNEYCSHIKNLDLCITTIDCKNENIMINKKTGKFKIIDLEDIYPITHFIPGLFWRGDEIISNHECWVLKNDFTWSYGFFNKSFEYYSDLLKLIILRHSYISPDTSIKLITNYKNLPYKI